MKLLRMVLVSTLLFGQQPEQDLRIRVNVNLIQIDVTVMDKDGKPVPGLKAEDFEVFRDNKKQAVRNVVWVDSRQNRPAPEKTDENPRRPLRPQEVRRTIALFLDDLSLSPASIYAARQALRDFVEKTIQPGDLVALFRSSSGVSILQQFTNDRRQLLSQIDSLTTRNNNAYDSLAPLQMNPLESSSDASIAQMAMEQRLRDEVMQRERQDAATTGMLSAARFVVRALGELPGRKSMVMLSESIQIADVPQMMTNPGMTSTMSTGLGAMGGARTRTLESIRLLVDSATRNGVVLYTVDPRGLVFDGLTAADQVNGNIRQVQGQMMQRTMNFNMSQDGMSLLAEETGGLFFKNTNDISGALAAAAQDQEGYYLIAFEPDDDTFEKLKSGASKYHSVRVRVKQSGLKVRHRKGFFGVADPEVKAEQPPLQHAIMSPFVTEDIPLQLTPFFFRGEDGKPALRAMLHADIRNVEFVEVPAAADDKNQTPWKQANIEQLVVLLDQRGQPVDQIGKVHTVKLRGKTFDRVMESGLTQELDLTVSRPGGFQLRTAVSDQKSKRTGSSMQFVTVPDLNQKRLTISDIGLQAVGWMESGDIHGSPSVRRFTPKVVMQYAALLYNAKGGKTSSQPDVEMQVSLYKNGKVVYQGKKQGFRPEKFKEGDPLNLMGSLTLGESTTPGTYTLQIAVRDNEAPKKAQFAVREIDFEIKKR